MKYKMPALALATLVVLSNTPVLASGGGKHSHDHSQSASSNDSKEALLLGAGEVRRINQNLGKVTLKHGPIGSEMPAMTMEFSVADPKLLEGIKKGQKVSFTINNDMVITEIKLAGSSEN
jgi:Cu(I)/Ag(I) efflux system protein CusF